ncbi:hypothetical protein [Acinetobacter baumannii]|uniref:hypothetical protein n=1 Tax=Acinetobacter baumannii TaxID=470 RepID=UPI0033901D89
MKGYVEIFDTMLSSLSHFTESDKPLSVKEIGCRLGLQTRTAQRIAKALQESGWLTSNKTGSGNLFSATDKAKALFLKAEQNSHASKLIEFVKEQGVDAIRDAIEEANTYGDMWINTKTLELSNYIPSGDSVAIPELKRLVKSLDLIEAFDGLEKLRPFFLLTDKSIGYTHVYRNGNGAFCFLDDCIDFIPAHAISIKRVMQAIEDHISIFGKQSLKLEKFKIGDKVESIDHRYTLASGCERYPYAYVVSLNPFQLMSERGDMHWRTTVKPENFKLISSTETLPEGVLKRMKREFLDEVLEGPSL